MVTQAKFDYVKLIDDQTGSILTEGIDITLDHIRVWSNLDDLRFPLAGSTLNEDETLVVQITTGNVFQVKTHQALEAGLQPSNFELI
jgi:hypothetical protein